MESIDAETVEYLKDIQSKKISSLISKVSTVDPTDKLSKLISKISKDSEFDVFYYNGKSTLSTNIRELLNAKNITKMDVESFLKPIPHLKPDDTIQKAAKIIVDYRTRQVAVVEKNKIIGVVSAKKILELLSKKGNKSIKAKMIYTKNPITVSSEKPLSNAKKIMTSKRLDHLPVIDNGIINQVLTPAHIIPYVLPQERQGKKSVGVRTAHKLEFEIGDLGSKRVPKCGMNDDLDKILKLILKTDTSCCLVNLDNLLQGIITFRDILAILTVK